MYHLKESEYSNGHKYKLEWSITVILRDDIFENFYIMCSFHKIGHFNYFQFSNLFSFKNANIPKSIIKYQNMKAAVYYKLHTDSIYTLSLAISGLGNEKQVHIQILILILLN